MLSLTGVADTEMTLSESVGDVVPSTLHRLPCQAWSGLCSGRGGRPVLGAPPRPAATVVSSLHSPHLLRAPNRCPESARCAMVRAWLARKTRAARSLQRWLSTTWHRPLPLGYGLRRAPIPTSVGAALRVPRVPTARSCLGGHPVGQRADAVSFPTLVEIPATRALSARSVGDRHLRVGPPFASLALRVRPCLELYAAYTGNTNRLVTYLPLWREVRPGLFCFARGPDRVTGPPSRVHRL